MENCIERDDNIFYEIQTIKNDIILKWLDRFSPYLVHGEKQWLGQLDIRYCNTACNVLSV